MPARPRGVLWDVGNVIVRWNPRTLYSKIFDDPAELDRFLTDVCSMDWHVEHDRGRPFADNIAALTAQHPHYADQIAAWRGRWMEMFSGAIPETENAIDELAARGVPQFGLTNMSAEIWGDVTRLSPVFAHLRDVVVSGVEGLLKPDPALFELACERFGMAPESLLFIDDNADNIAAAERLGFAVHLFENPSNLHPVIVRNGLL